MKHNRCLIFVFLLLLNFGCGAGGPALAPVTGTVTLHGKPYPKGIVTYIPKEGGPAGMSTTDADGKYEIWSSGKKGAVIGLHKISVTTVLLEEESDAPPPEQLKSDDPRYLEMANSRDPYKKKAAKKEPIPAKYNTQSTLTFEVKSGTNVNDIELK